MKNNKVNLEIGKKYSITFLQENNIIKFSQSSIYVFFKKDEITYVFFKDNLKHPQEYVLAAIWES